MILLRFVEERVVLQLLHGYALVGVLVECNHEYVFELFILHHADNFVFAPHVDQFAQVLEGVRHWDVRRDHLQKYQPKTIDVVFTSFLFVFEQDALVDLGLLGIEQGYLPDAQVSDLDVSIVGVNVNGLACQLAMYKAVLMEEL